MKNVITQSTSATSASTTAADQMKQSLGLNKDDFLKLFISQLKYQDPLKPQDPTAMLDQLSQLSMVEQSYNTNTALNNLLTAQSNSSNLSTVSFIGKEVKATGDAIPFDGTNPATLQFNQNLATASNQIVIKNSDGTVVKTLTTSALTSGDNSVKWDGRDESGNLLPAGNYNFSVSGKTVAGTDIIGTTYTSGIINGISFANGSPLLTIGSTLIPFSNVISVKGV